MTILTVDVHDLEVDHLDVLLTDQGHELLCGFNHEKILHFCMYGLIFVSFNQISYSNLLLIASFLWKTMKWNSKKTEV